MLTSGGEKNAIDGIDTIAKLVRLAGNRIATMAAGGIRAANLRQIAQATGMREVHAGLRSTVPSPMRFQNKKISFIQSVPDDYEQLIVTEEDVRKLVNEAGRV